MRQGSCLSESSNARWSDALRWSRGFAETPAGLAEKPVVTLVPTTSHAARLDSEPQPAAPKPFNLADYTLSPELVQVRARGGLPCRTCVRAALALS